MKRKFLEDLGLEKDVIDQIMDENGKDVEAEKKKVEKIEGERDDLRSQLTTAKDTLKSFEGIDPAAIQQQLADWKKKAEDAERDYTEKLQKRDFDDALKAELETVRFSSEAAKKAVMAEITEAGLKLKDGKIMGLSRLPQLPQKLALSTFSSPQFGHFIIPPLSRPRAVFSFHWFALSCPSAVIAIETRPIDTLFTVASISFP